MDKKITILSSSTIVLLLPAVALAQNFNVPGVLNTTLLNTVIDVFGTALQVLWVVAMAVVIVMFVIAGFKFLTGQGDPGKMTEARQAVVWGLVGTAVIILAWSIVTIIRRELGL